MTERTEERACPVAAAEKTMLPDGRHVWLIKPHAEAQRLLGDPRFTNDTDKMGHKAPLAALPPEVKAVIASDMLNCDPPEHTRLRRLVARIFTARRVARFRPSVERIASELLDAFDDRDEADLLDEFAGPMATRVLAELIGIPDADCQRVRRWSEMFVSNLLTDDDQVRQATNSLKEFAQDLVERKRADRTGEDLVSHLIQTRDGGERLSDNELSSMVFLVMIAGQMATAQLLAKAVYLLLTHPDQLSALRSDASLLPGAVDEFLRYDPPLRVSAFRMATEPVQISGVTIPTGDIAICSLLSANHDESRFPNPERLDIRRSNNQHLAFGYGLHRCLGGNLAVLEAEVGISALLRRFPDLRLAIPEDRIPWAETGLMRQLLSLPVTLT